MLLFCLRIGIQWIKQRRDLIQTAKEMKIEKQKKKSKLGRERRYNKKIDEYTWKRNLFSAELLATYRQKNVATGRDY